LIRTRLGDVAARNTADQRELALGVLRRLLDGKWGWKIDPAYIRQRVERGAPVCPTCGRR